MVVTSGSARPSIGQVRWWLSGVVGYPLGFVAVYFVTGFVLEPFTNGYRPVWAWIVFDVILLVATWLVGLLLGRAGAPPRLWLVAVAWAAVAFWPLLVLFTQPWPVGLDSDTAWVAAPLASFLLAGIAGLYAGQLTARRQQSHYLARPI